MEPLVRSYRPADRAELRRVCHRTGFMGEPADWYWRDERSFADIWTSYYTDAEPESTFVADLRGTVVGFILGCVDSDTAWNPARIGVRHGVGRACILRPGTAPVLWRTVTDVVTGRLTGRPTVTEAFTDPRWPSHLHINLLPAVRGAGTGKKLMEAWLGRLREVDSPGCHLETLAENGRAIAFFRSVGFRRFGDPEVVPGERRRDGGRLHRQVMVQDLA